MSDALQTFHVALDALADDIHAEHVATFKRRDSENFRPSTYAGMRTVISRRIKYRDCEYVRERGQSVRKLSEREIAEFHAAVQRAIEAAS